MSVRIERTIPRRGEPEHPVETARGFELVDQRLSGARPDLATFIRSIDDAAYLVEQGYSIRMTGPGKRAAVVPPAGLRIVRA